MMAFKSLAYCGKSIKMCTKSLKAFMSTVAKVRRFVPAHEEVRESDVEMFRCFLATSGRCLVLTGAGVSTESDIPDYRSEGVGLYASSSSRPVIYKDFLSSAQLRRRYWARNFTGWPVFSSKQPNVTHVCLKSLEDRGIITGVVTQNVDSLHSKAGSANVIELHGSAYRVICIDCNEYREDRAKFQELLLSLNPTGTTEVLEINPDGDVTLPEGATRDFNVPACPKCGGILKPDIVFFGDNVPKSRAQAVREMVMSSDSLLVMGSSLTVYSSYRIVLQAKELDKKILIVNIGPTRADCLTEYKIEVRCGELFERSLDLILR